MGFVDATMAYSFLLMWGFCSCCINDIGAILLPFVQPVDAFSFRSSRVHQGGAGGRGHGSSSDLSFRVVLEDEGNDEDLQLRGGGGGTTTTFPGPANPGTANQVAVPNVDIPPALLKLLIILKSVQVQFWNDSLQSLRRRFAPVRILMRSIGLFDDSPLLQGENDKAELFIDDDEMVSMIAFTRKWPISHTKQVWASVYRTSTLLETHENTARVSLVLGPHVKALSFIQNARSLFVTKISSGAARRIAPGSQGDDGFSVSSVVLPFAQADVYSNLLIPFRFKKRPISLGITHVAALGTTTLPRHVVNQVGYRARVRDYKERSDTVGSPYWEYSSVPPASSYLRGAVQLDTLLCKDVYIGVFGDYSFSNRIQRGTHDDSNTKNIIQKSSVGVSLRTSRLPFKLEASYSEDHKVGVSFGLTRR